jgi:hypothetical protein
MGCHTWFYKYKKEVDWEFVKKDYIIKSNKLISKVNSLLNNKIPKEWINDEETIEYYKTNGIEIIKILNKHIELANQDKCINAICYRYYYWDKLHYYKHNLYTHLKLHDLFRIYTYPKNKLTSFNQTLDFIYKNIDDIEFLNDTQEETIKKLRKFWDKYPNGLITFG